MTKLLADRQRCRSAGRALQVATVNPVLDMRDQVTVWGLMSRMLGPHAQRGGESSEQCETRRQARPRALSIENAPATVDDERRKTSTPQTTVRGL